MADLRLPLCCICICLGMYPSFVLHAFLSSFAGYPDGLVFLQASSTTSFPEEGDSLSDQLLGTSADIPIHLKVLIRGIGVLLCYRGSIGKPSPESMTERPSRQVSNIIVRFQWILYIPVANDEFQLRTFIVALLEMVRRFQWNFCMFILHSHPQVSR